MHNTPEYDIKNLPKKIKEIRTLRGETQTSLAHKLGVKRQAIINWEKEEDNSIPEIKTLIKLCKVLDCTFDYLLGSPDIPEIESISRASFYSGISPAIIRESLDNPTYQDCLNFFMSPDNCKDLFDEMELLSWKKYIIDTSMKNITGDLKTQLESIFEEFLSATTIGDISRDSYKKFLKYYFPKDKITKSIENKESRIQIRKNIGARAFENLFKNNVFSYTAFINYLVEHSYTALLYKPIFEAKKLKLADSFIDLFTKYLENS